MLVVLAYLKLYAAPFLIAFGTAWIQGVLKKKATADGGAADQRAAQAVADAAAAADAKKVADALHAETDAQFGADAARWRP